MHPGPLTYPSSLRQPPRTRNHHHLGDDSPQSCTRPVRGRCVPPSGPRLIGTRILNRCSGIACSVSRTCWPCNYTVCTGVPGPGSSDLHRMLMVSRGRTISQPHLSYLDISVSFYLTRCLINLNLRVKMFGSTKRRLRADQIHYPRPIRDYTELLHPRPIRRGGRFIPSEPCAVQAGQTKRGAPTRIPGNTGPESAKFSPKNSREFLPKLRGTVNQRWNLLRDLRLQTETASSGINGHLG